MIKYIIQLKLCKINILMDIIQSTDKTLSSSLQNFPLKTIALKVKLSAFSEVYGTLSASRKCIRCASDLLDVIPNSLTELLLNLYKLGRQVSNGLHLQLH